MKIDLLYFDNCPSWEQGLENLKSALASEKISIEINLIRIERDEDATTEKFLGSPSFRVNGHDLWSEERRSYHLSCRVYTTETGMRSFPSSEMLREKIHDLHLSNNC